jgi:hypothetical protein
VSIAALEASSPAMVFDFLEGHVSPRGRAHWAWKYQLDHATGRAFYHVATDGRVGGFIGTLPTVLHAEDRTARAAWFVDWATRPGEGGVGAGVALLRRAESATDVLLTLQGSHDTQQILPKLRWHVVDTPATWILRSSARAIAVRGAVRERPWLRVPALVAGAILARIRRVRRRHDARFALDAVERFPSTYDAVWEARRSEFAPLMERSSAQLNFMCADYPGHGYRMFLLRDAGDVVGHLVLRVDEKDGARRGRIVDTLWPRTRTGAVEWLIREATVRLQECGVDYIECTASAPDLERALAACGFARLRPVPVWYHRLPDGIPTPERWFVTYLDCDRAYR